MNSAALETRLKSWQVLIRTWLGSEGAKLYYWCLGVTLLWRAGLEFLNQTIVPIMTPGPAILTGEPIHQGIKEGILRWVKNWDASWYSGISQNGYVIHNHMHGQESIAFFPLFPYLMRWLNEATGISYKIIGLSLNLLFTAGILFFVMKLTNLMAVSEKPKHGAVMSGKLAAIFILLNPSAFFFAAYYADALLALTVTASIYFAYRDKYLVAALAAGLATATKSIGIVALPAILLIYLSRSDKPLLQTLRAGWAKLLAICVLSVSGALVYMAYLWARFGDPLAFLKIEKYWQRNVSGFFLNDIWQTWYNKIFDVHYFGSAGNYLYDIFLMAIPLGALAISIYLIVKHSAKYLWLVAMTVLTVIIPISTGTLLSLNRYVLILTPLFAYYFAYIYGKSVGTKRLSVLAGYISSLTLIAFTLLYLSSRFVG